MSAESGCKPNFQDAASADKMPTGPTAKMAVLQYFAQGGDAFPVLLHGADGDADPFGQVVAFHRPDDHFVLKQGAKNRKAIADIHQNKVCGAGNEPKHHCDKLIFEKGANFIYHAFYLALLLFV